MLEIPPPGNQIVSEVVFTNDESATAAITGIYSEMMNNSNNFMSGATTIYAGMSADELYHFNNASTDAFVKNELTELSHSLLSINFWDKAYKYIYTSNRCLEFLEKDNELTPAIEERLTGEALFIRAISFYYLANLFGDIPMPLTSDYSINAVLARKPINQVYDQIISDLERAIQLLPATYVAPEKTRPNKWTASALLSRLYLVVKDYNKAELLTSTIINSGQYNLPLDLNTVFKKSGSEIIWQLKPVNPIWNTWEGRNILPATINSLPTFLVTPSLLSAFELGDFRKAEWISSRIYSSQTVYYPSKYKVYGNNAPVTEYYVVIRLAEMYLIRAEARAQLNNLEGSLNDLNLIRNRAGLENVIVSDKDALLSYIFHERRIELMFEWGYRWFDLKRVGKADEILSVEKPGTWQITDQLWPIPVSQLNANPFLTQNPGY